jgi:hypothetical protein
LKLNDDRRGERMQSDKITIHPKEGFLLCFVDDDDLLFSIRTFSLSSSDQHVSFPFMLTLYFIPHSREKITDPHQKKQRVSD